MINEALAEEVQRGEQKKRSDKATAAVPESGSARTEGSLKSASSTASGSGQQKEKMSIPDDESRLQVEDTSEIGIGESTEHRQQTPGEELLWSQNVAVATQEAVDRYCEKAMRIASVEQIELGNIMERTSLESCRCAKRMDGT